MTKSRDNAEFPNVGVTLDDAQILTNKTLAAPALTGNTTTNGLIDGRDVATDGSKLDDVDAGANVNDVAGDTHAAASKTSPIDADELPLVDSAVTFGLKRLTWANLKATLKTYFDTLFQPIPETGTWTPALQDQSYSDADGQTYSIQDGTYTKIGNQVFGEGFLIMTSLGSLVTTENATINGFPFAAGGGTGSGSISICFCDGTNLAAGVSIMGNIPNATPRCDLQAWDLASGATSLLISETGSAMRMKFTFQYTTSA